MTSRFIASVVAMVICVAAAAQKVATPDFAFPKKVAEQSRAALEKAIEKNDGPMVLGELVKLTIAETAVDGNNVNTAIATIERTRALTADSLTCAMIDLLLAEVYRQAYDRRSWEYDARTLPLTPFPADVDQWSGDQFRAKVDMFNRRALDKADLLQRADLAKWGRTLVIGKLTKVYYPTLYDFAVHKVIDSIESMNRFEIDDVVPLRALSLPAGRLHLTNENANRITQLYDALIDFHADGSPAPRIMAQIDRLAFLSEHVFYIDSKKAQTLAVSRLKELYESLADKTEYAGEVLIALRGRINRDSDSDPDEVKWYYTEIKDFIRRYPAFDRLDCLLSVKADLEDVSVTVSAPLCFAPGKPVEISVSAWNMIDGRLDIYKVNDDSFAQNMYPAPAGTPVQSLAVSVGDTLVCHGKAKLSFTVEKEGAYIIVPVVNGSPTKDFRYDRVWCTRLALTTTEFNNEVYAFTLDPADGHPVSGSKILVSTRSGKVKEAGVTGSDGALTLPAGLNFNSIAAKNGSSVTPSHWQYDSSLGTREQPEKLSVSASAFTALPIYHPGDTVEYVAVIQGYTRSLNTHLLADFKINVKFRDANGQQIDTAELTTDEFGRVSGSFAIPDNGLTGNYNISLHYDDGFCGTLSVMVSDYKLPTFTIETLPAVTRDGNVTLRGTAMTYSGFPLAQTDVKVAVGVMTLGYWFNAHKGHVFYNTECVTDAEGRFSVELPASVLDGSPQPDGRFNAVFTVTSPSGETHDAAMIFARGPVYRLTADIPESINASEPYAFNLKVTDTDGEPVSVGVNCRICNGDSVVSAMSFMSGNPVVDLSAVPSGFYELVLTTEHADSLTANVVIYRPDDTASPVSYALWTPAETLKADGNTVDVLLGATNDTNVLQVVMADGKIVSKKWLPFPAGMRRVTVDFPDGVKDAAVMLCAMADYKFSSINIKVILPSSRSELKIKAEAMRDRLVPGSSETWSFTVADTRDKAEDAAVILRMYNSAFDALQTSNWSFGENWNWTPSSIYWRTGIYGGYSRSYLWPVKSPEWISVSAPAWQTYGRSLCGAMRKYMMARATSDGAVMEFKSAALLADNAAMPESAEFDLAADAEVLEEVPVAGYGGAPDKRDAAQDAPFSYRDSEVALAFFRPMLTTGADGRLTFSFTVPDANTTWKFNALAFTRSMLSAEMQRSFIASKPVMVQPSLPRFLRQGDRAEVRALVMNNSDEPQSVTTVIEIFNPATGRVIDTVTQTDRIEPKASAIALITVDAPLDMAALGYRVKSSTGTFADGEQAAIPLLAAAQPVITADPFYIPPGEALFTTSLPRWEKGSRVSLEFCENPAWYVVTALPSLSSAELTTSVNAAGAIFSAAVADGILRSNPSVAKALKQWTAGDRSDSTLVSMLQRNADLKIALLQATPWMMDARSDSERMDRLALLFDRGEIDRSISRGVDVLARLQKHGGGWGWTGGADEASEWATQRVLAMLGDLNRLGWLPADRRLADMTGNAVKWLDARVAEQYRKTPGGNYTEYVFIRDLFPDIRQSSAAERVSSATVQQLIGRWRDLDAPAKAVAALILDSHNYASTSRTILESLREYAESSPERGMWWPSVEQGWWSMNPAAATSLILDAFARVEPGCADVDRIRQWLVLQKGAQNWGNSVSASRMVASFISASGKWIAPARGAEIKVGDMLLDVTPVDRTLGYIRTDISDNADSGATLAIARSDAQTPSWGAVYCRGVQSMTSIEPHSVPDLSVVKECLIVNADGSTRPMYGRARVGDRVRVTLTVKSSRAMDYVAIIDNRPACFEPVEQLPGRVWCDGLAFYRENSDAATSLFINRLPAGNYVLTYDMWVNSAGVYTMGAASAQSQYQPALAANSSGGMVTVEP